VELAVHAQRVCSSTAPQVPLGTHKANARSSHLVLILE
jgi:hypothetical protein